MPRAPRDHKAAGGFFARVASADHQHPAVIERVKNLFGQLDRDGAYRNAAALNAGFGADVLGDVKPPFERPC